MAMMLPVCAVCGQLLMSGGIGRLRCVSVRGARRPAGPGTHGHYQTRPCLHVRIAARAQNTTAAVLGAAIGPAVLGLAEMGSAVQRVTSALPVDESTSFFVPKYSRSLLANVAASGNAFLIVSSDLSDCRKTPWMNSPVLARSSSTGNKLQGTESCQVLSSRLHSDTGRYVTQRCTAWHDAKFPPRHSNLDWVADWNALLSFESQFPTRASTATSTNVLNSQEAEMSAHW